MNGLLEKRLESRERTTLKQTRPLLPIVETVVGAPYSAESVEVYKNFQLSAGNLRYRKANWLQKLAVRYFSVRPGGWQRLGTTLVATAMVCGFVSEGLFTYVVAHRIFWGSWSLGLWFVASGVMTLLLASFIWFCVASEGIPFAKWHRTEVTPWDPWLPADVQLLILQLFRECKRQGLRGIHYYVDTFRTHIIRDPLLSVACGAEEYCVKAWEEKSF